MQSSKLSPKSIKTSKEIRLIGKACKLTDNTFDYILKEIKEKISEKELALKIIRFVRIKRGMLAFKPIVSFGQNSAEIHHKPTDKKLRKGQIIMLDFGAKIDRYCSDMTRTIFFGKATDKQKRIYQTVLEAQKQAIKFIANHYDNTYHHSEKPELSAKEVDKIARDFIISCGFPTIPHSLGHGIGKKVHEGFRLSPKRENKLLPGMAFTIEPGIYLKNYGGVRIEDTFVLEKNGLPRRKAGLRQLTNSTKKLIELYRLTS
ncbi:MAG: M24 family metallopeptidase [Candidatus Levybacteria bacterium]|nr:M24 family metallopeptidase [Candidatus Levybacteria bacterium]